MIDKYKDKKFMTNGNWKEKNSSKPNILKMPLKTSQLQIKGESKKNVDVTHVVNQGKDGKQYGVGNVVLRLKQKDPTITEQLSEIMENVSKPNQLTNLKVKN